MQRKKCRFLEEEHFDKYINSAQNIHQKPALRMLHAARQNMPMIIALSHHQPMHHDVCGGQLLALTRL